MAKMELHCCDFARLHGDIVGHDQAIATLRDQELCWTRIAVKAQYRA